MVIITNNQRDAEGTLFKNYAKQFLAQSKNKVVTIQQTKKEDESNAKVRVRAVIKGEDRLVSYHKTTGLFMTSTKKGATAWVGFSSPVERSQRLFDFYYDAFMMLSITDGLDNWTLTLFNQDTKSLNGFEQSPRYNIITGQSIETDMASDMKHADSDKIKITFGSTMDLSKSASTIGKPFKQGMELAFNKARKEGGVGAFIPHVKVFDDAYTPNETRESMWHN